MMNQQLALSLQLNYQASLSDFLWPGNELLKQQLLQGRERFLYLWGKPGCGKSHLLQGLCQYYQEQGKSTIYLPLSVLKEWGPESIQDLASQDLIALDDIEVIANIPEWEESLFHLYNQLRDNEQSILIIGTQFSPASTPIQLPDLCSRLSWGLVMQMQMLEDSDKTLVLQQQASKKGLTLSSSVAQYILRHYNRDMHLLEKTLNQLDQASLAAQRKLTLPFVKSVLDGYNDSKA